MAVDHFAHLKPLELGARSLCAARGVDPDERFPTAHPQGIVGTLFYRPLWHLAAEELLDLSLQLSALRMCQPKNNA